MEELQTQLLKLRTLSTDLFNEYTTWIKNKPSHASDIETGVKVFSYFLHGRSKGSTILPELLYCASNLLSFWHDTLLKAEAEKLLLQQRPSNIPNHAAGARNRGQGQANGSIPQAEAPPAAAAGTSQANNTNAQGFNAALMQKIRTTLTILEYFEVFLEVGARHLWGDAGRWIVVLIVQAIKAGLRLTLLFQFKVGLIESPAIQPFNRKSHTIDSTTGQVSANLVFVLKHSGRVVRKINASPSLSSRTWKLPSVPAVTFSQNDLPPLRLLAEVLHILRPLCHLAGLGIWGTSSWKPWMLSLGLDVTSLHLHGRQDSSLRNSEKQELTRRTYALLYYLLRSPFYDSLTKQRLLTPMVRFSNRIPIVGHLCSMLAEAIPEWQQTYSYAWNDF